MKALVVFWAILLFLSCSSSSPDYCQIDRVVTYSIPFGIMSPIGIGPEMVMEVGEKNVFSDEEKLSEIAQLITALEPVNLQYDDERMDIYLQSTIFFKNGIGHVQLKTDRTMIVLDGLSYSYSKELIDKLRSGP